MNIILVSQCSGRAINESRRILDQFAERTGVRTWATPITENGLSTVRKLLKQTARKNTAVACHWVHSNGEFELLWIVGKAAMYNERGRVPTNLTERDVLKSNDEHRWHSLNCLSLLAQMAALWHDFGKANQQFQAKLQDRNAKDAFRHEWVSLRMFEAFVGGSSDKDWLTRLAKHAASPDFSWLERIHRDPQTACKQPMATMGPIARAVGWLVLSHHGLPQSEVVDPAAYQDVYANLSLAWSRQKPDVEPAGCWKFPHHAPDRSQTWRTQAAALSKRFLSARASFASLDNSADLFALTLSRLALVLADHHYSSKPAQTALQDSSYQAYANTDRDTGARKQKLDEHLLGVADISKAIVRALPKLEHELPRIARHKAFTRNATDSRFAWQNRAFDLTLRKRADSTRFGFFGVNMASTGCGKTIANARIAYALADPQQGARFTIALGLRTLTLQTGRALGTQMGLDHDDLAVLVGSAAVRELFELHGKTREQQAQAHAADMGSVQPGSQSADPIFPSDAHVIYEGAISESKLKDWLDGARGNANKLVQAPVLVCTIDHLMPACEATRGGSQLAPLLRLLTSDVVLDEPDDFDLNDLPALSRFIHTLGLLGSRVLLSSATLAPALVQGLFEAYRAGRALYQQHCGEPGLAVNVVCAWFDEFSSHSAQCAKEADFAIQHQSYVQDRLRCLAQQVIKRRAWIEAPRDVTEDDPRKASATAYAKSITQGAQALHERHHSQDGERRVSVGLVRMANIEPLIAVAQLLLKLKWPDTVRVHLCVYHSRFPLLMRSAIEETLDAALLRGHKPDQPDPFLRHPKVKAAIEAHPLAQNHIFLVLASPVAEVGRDHDYDWAIVEPSSMRSIIQLAGRVRRHRACVNEAPNILLLNKNIKALKRDSVCFTRPGFEDSAHRLASQQLDQLMQPAEYQALSAAPRIAARTPLDAKQSLVDLEHVRLQNLLVEQDSPESVRRYWQTQQALTGMAQRLKPFRTSQPTMSYFLSADLQPDGAPKLARRERNGKISESIPYQSAPTMSTKQTIGIWPLRDLSIELAELAARLNLSAERCAERFATLELEVDGQDLANRDWCDLGGLGFSLHQPTLSR
jgi:CRISPR-associated endonuclease/helicase Cas3